MVGASDASHSPAPCAAHFKPAQVHRTRQEPARLGDEARFGGAERKPTRRVRRARAARSIGRRGTARRPRIAVAMAAAPTAHRCAACPVCHHLRIGRLPGPRDQVISGDDRRPRWAWRTPPRKS